MLKTLLILLFLSFVNSSVRKWAIEFHSETNFEEFASKYGLQYTGPVGVLSHVHLFTLDTEEHEENHLKRDLHLSFFDSLKRDGDHPTIKWHEEQIPKKREKRFIFEDPLYPKQWHLHGSNTAHVNTEDVWNQGIFGKGVRIAIVDDGIQSDHPDLADNVKLDSSYNFNRDIPSPDPTYLTGPSGDWHGTASAGTAAARNESKHCGVGAAPLAELAGIAILQNNADVTDDIEAKALAYRYDANHIYSNSWGPILPGSGGHKNEGPGTLAYSAIQTAIFKGRDGLGSIYVWAAGNDGPAHDNCNYDGYANMRYTVLIGSVDPNGGKPAYSEPCAALTAVTPGGIPQMFGKQIVTTDLMGTNGLSTSECYENFAGTSASCPLAAGVLALILEVNPTLSWLELQYVIAKGTEKHNDDPDWRQNGAGKWVSHNYGWGLLNAQTLVKAAKEWGRTKITEKLVSASNNSEVPIFREGISKIRIRENYPVHHIEVKLWTDHPNVEKTKVTLISPMGTSAILADPHKDSLSSWDGWMFLSRMHWGENIGGIWQLKVEDDNQNYEKPNHITLWILNLHCRQFFPNETVPFSEEEIPQKIVPVIITEEIGNEVFSEEEKPLETVPIIIQKIPNSLKLEENPIEIQPAPSENHPVPHLRFNPSSSEESIIEELIIILLSVGCCIALLLKYWKKYYDKTGGTAQFQ